MEFKSFDTIYIILEQTFGSMPKIIKAYENETVALSNLRPNQFLSGPVELVRNDRTFKPLNFKPFQTDFEPIIYPVFPEHKPNPFPDFNIPKPNAFPDFDIERGF